MSDKKKLISICIPCYNEEKNIELMYERTVRQVEMWPQYEFEIIFADNHSVDDSEKILRRIAIDDHRVKVIINMANFGPDRSGLNLTTSANGDAIISLPCDMQEPPELISDFIKEWQNGYDVVLCQKKKSKESIIKYLCRKLYYKIIDELSEQETIPQVIGYGLITREVNDLKNCINLQDSEYQMRYIITEYGFRTKIIEYVQNQRREGKSSYTLFKYFRFALVSLCNISVSPLYIISFVGVLLSIVSIMVAIGYFIYKLVYWDSFNVGMAPLVIGMFLLSGVQLVSLGVIGVYVGIISKRVLKKPIVIERERINF